MHLVRCPCGCGHVFDADDPRVRVSALPLSCEARELLANAPHRWKRGQAVPVQTLADFAGLSYRRARRAMWELVREGYATTIPLPNGRGSRYVGVYTMIRTAEDKLAA